jgi:hypothetical protein
MDMEMWNALPASFPHVDANVVPVRPVHPLDSLSGDLYSLHKLQTFFRRSIEPGCNVTARNQESMTG